MANSKIHGILSAVHGLLNSYSDSELLEASRYAGLSRAIRTALHALASESARTRSSLGSMTAGRSLGQSEPVPRAAPRIAESEILACLRSSPYFVSTSEIVEFAKSLGIRIQRSPKESKDRLARKVVRAITLMPDGRQSQIMRELSASRSGQTQGWIDVIKTSRDE